MRTIIKDLAVYSQSQGATLPKVGLKDVFLSIIGKKVIEPEPVAPPPPPESLRAAGEEIGQEALRVAAGDILLWLGSRHLELQEGTHSPLRTQQTEGVEGLHLFKPEAMRGLLDATPDLAELFEIQGPCLIFRDAVSEPERLEIAEYVHQNYRRPLKKRS